MKYISTRGSMSASSFSEILLTGLAPDGGLAMPENIPTLSTEILEQWRMLPYHQLAFEIMQLFIDDIDAGDLKQLLNKTYSPEVFHSEAITPLTPLNHDGLYLLELSNGPSLAFKDMAMQFLGHAFEYVLEKQGAQINILGATSGDTGSAAEVAMIGKENVNVFMLSPHGRMSAFQQAQMYSLDEKNIFNIAVKGVFDDCQDLVKAINQDADFKSQYKIGAVNSINWARVLAQIVYYFKGYFALNLPTGKTVDFCVPSGNFGNVFAGYIAKQMGLPIETLLVATNENDVLFEFFTTGVYRTRPAEKVEKTSSPSMDIGKASNFERYIYHVCGQDPRLTTELWQTLAQTGEFDLKQTPHWSNIIKSGFAAGKSSHADRLKTIEKIYQENGRLIDPHTADGVFVAQNWRAAENSTRPMICLETAQPAKFAEVILEATNQEPPRPKGFANLENLPRKVEVMENDVEALKTFIIKNL